MYKYSKSPNPHPLFSYYRLTSPICSLIIAVETAAEKVVLEAVVFDGVDKHTEMALIEGGITVA